MSDAVNILNHCQRSGPPKAGAGAGQRAGTGSGGDPPRVRCGNEWPQELRGGGSLSGDCHE